jgi:hypothetical protein
MLECRRKFSPVSLVLQLVHRISPASDSWHESQSGTACRAFFAEYSHCLKNDSQPVTMCYYFCNPLTQKRGNVKNTLFLLKMIAFFKSVDISNSVY